MELPPCPLCKEGLLLPLSDDNEPFALWNLQRSEVRLRNQQARRRRHVLQGRRVHRREGKGRQEVDGVRFLIVKILSIAKATIGWA